MSSNKQYEVGALADAGTIPLCVPVMGGKEWEYIKDCLDTGWVSSVGAYVDRFERLVADYVGVQYAVACNSGTSALHIALLVAGVQPDDEVLVSTLSFIAPANAIRYAHAHPIFIDADPTYWQMDTTQAAQFLESECHWVNGELRNSHTGRRVKAILPVHILGHPVEMNPLVALAEKFQLAIIEDATESLGATYEGRKVGALGDIACFSFNGNKTITTGGGGMIVTHDESFARRAKYLTTQAKDDPLEYIHHEVGYNYRLTNIQAAMGVAQMEVLADYLAAKARIAQTYADGLAGVGGISLMPHAPWANSANWLYTVLVDESRYGMDSRALLRHLAAAKIQARPLWHPLHLSQAHATAPQRQNPIAERLCQMSLSLPSSVNLPPHDQTRVIQTIIKGSSEV